MNRGQLFAIATFASVVSAHAGSPYYDLTEAQKRRIVVPDIKALTYCVARVALNDTDAVTYYRKGGFPDYIGRQLGKCPREMNALLELYESTYGDGEAERFIKGPYLSDLPRAVLSVIRSQLDAKVADQQADEERAREAEAAQQAETKRKAEEDRLATLKAQADQEAQKTRIAREKQERVEIATRTMNLLRDKFYDCADQQLPGLVKSGETAEVLANTVMTICSKPLNDALDAGLAVARAQDRLETQEASDDALTEELRRIVKERVVADAVQAKAGVGQFSPANTQRFN